MEKAKQKPVDRVRLGRIAAAIWRNDTKDGTFFNVTVERSYRDGDNIKSSDSFGRDDLLLLAKVVDMAHTRIYELQAEERESHE